MPTIIQWMQSIWKQFRSNPFISGFQQFMDAVKSLPIYLRFGALLAVAVLAFIGILDYFDKLAQTPSAVLAGVAIVILLLFVGSMAAQLRSETSHLSPKQVAILTFLTQHGGVTQDDIAKALNLPVSQVKAACDSLYAKGFVSMVAGCFGVTSAGQAELAKGAN